jgi:predicted N-acetyltransferase YhbS
MVIRPEEPRDRRAIHALETAAFAQPAEAELVRYHSAFEAVA